MLLFEGKQSDATIHFFPAPGLFFRFYGGITLSFFSSIGRCFSCTVVWLFRNINLFEIKSWYYVKMKQGLNADARSGSCLNTRYKNCCDFIEPYVLFPSQVHLVSIPRYLILFLKKNSLLRKSLSFYPVTQRIVTDVSILPAEMNPYFHLMFLLLSKRTKCPFVINTPISNITIRYTTR